MAKRVMKKAAKKTTKKTSAGKAARKPAKIAAKKKPASKPAPKSAPRKSGGSDVAWNFKLIAHDTLAGFGGMGEGMAVQVAKESTSPTRASRR